VRADTLQTAAERHGALPVADVLVPPPRGAARIAARWVGAVWVGAQLLIPLGYYLGHDRYDERFSWRMFSAVRLEACRVELEEWPTRLGATEPVRVDPLRVLPAPWVALLQRRRAEVTARFLDARCARPGTARVRLTTRCTAPSGGSPTVDSHTVDCAGERPS
jgi:hypothetical protein